MLSYWWYHLKQKMVTAVYCNRFTKRQLLRKKTFPSSRKPFQALLDSLQAPGISHPPTPASSKGGVHGATHPKPAATGGCDRRCFIVRGCRQTPTVESYVNYHCYCRPLSPSPPPSSVEDEWMHHTGTVIARPQRRPARDCQSVSLFQPDRPIK